MQYDLQQFEREFMDRTNQILAEYRGKYNATLLLNSMVGLLIIPRERLLRFLPKEPLSASTNWGIPSNAIICVERGQGKELGDRSICWFVIKLRNAVAHFHVLPLHESGEVVGFEFWDRSGFRAQLSLLEMRQFLNTVSQHLEDEWRKSSHAAELSNNGTKWSKKAKLFTRAPTERVYVIDCPDGFQRQCYEISSTCPEYYIFGCVDDMPIDGATDVIVEPDTPTRQEKIIELAHALSTELPETKRLSVYTNDEHLISRLEVDVAETAKARLSFFGIFNIQFKRQIQCPKPVLI